MKSIYHTLEKSKDTLSLPPHAETVTELLQQAFDGNLHIGDCRRAPSEWWRNELEFLQRPQPERWVTRVHLFEDGPCHHGRYIGYANVRPREAGDTDIPAIADAFLAPPFRMLSSRYNLPGARELSQIYGEPYFWCLPYVMPAFPLGGFCSHACLYMAMITMIPYDSRPLGSLDMVLWMNLRNDRIGWGPKPIKPTVIKAQGLSPSDSLNILRKGNCNLWGLDIAWLRLKSEEHSDLQAATEFLTLIQQHIEAGLPVMLHIDFAKLYPAYPSPPPGWERHSILLIGTGYNDDNEATFVYHDPFVGPYLEATWPMLFQGMSWFDKGEEQEAVAIAVVPRDVRYPLKNCHMDTLQETLPWHVELVSKRHFYRRLRRSLTAGLGLLDAVDMRIAINSLKILIPEDQLPSYMWLFSLSRTNMPLDEANPVAYNMAYFYNATTKYPRRPASKVPRIARVFVEAREGQKYVGVQQGMEGYGRLLHIQNDRLVIVDLDDQGTEVTS